MLAFNLPLSLKRSALTSVAAILWSTHEFTRNTSSMFKDDLPNFEFWSERQKEVEARAMQLPLPNDLKSDLLRFVGAVAYEISRWGIYHIKKYKLVEKMPNKFIWTPHGTINRCRTAEMLVNDNSMNIKDRFTLACVYCLRSFMFALWLDLDAESRSELKLEAIRPEEDLLRSVGFWYKYVEDIPRRLWPWCAKEEELALQEHGLGFPWVSNEFIESIHCGNITAAKVFLPEADVVTEESADFILYRLAIDQFLRHVDSLLPLGQNYFSGQYTHVLCLALNLLDEKQQLAILSKRPRAALSLFLEWPWQSYFFKLYEGIGQHLSDVQFCDILGIILAKQEFGCKDYDYLDLFVQVWMKASGERKQSVLGSCHSKTTLIRHYDKFKDLCASVSNGDNYKQLVSNGFAPFQLSFLTSTFERMGYSMDA